MAGQHLTGWGLPSLRRAVAGQWDAMIPPTDRRQPQAPELTPISSGLLTGNCCLPMLCCRGMRHWSDLSRAQARAMIWRTWDAQSSGPPSLTVLTRSNGKDKPIQLASGWLQELPEGIALQEPAALGAPLRIICWGLLP